MKHKISHKEILELPAHEIATNYPRISGVERDGVKESIKQEGVHTPVIWWRDPDGVAWLIDGLNRRELVMELAAEKFTVSISGIPLDLVGEEFIGSELEALRRVRRENTDRRHLTSSQRIAVAVKNYDCEMRMVARERQISVQEAKRETRHGLNQKLADISGTNKHYSSDCLTLQEEAPKLLDKVASGECTIQSAKRSLKRIKEGLPEKPNEDEDERPPTLPPEPKAVYQDGLGNDVPDDLGEIFSARSLAKAIIAALKDLSKLADAFTDHPGGGTLDKKMVLADIKNLRLTFENGQPHVQCPHCKGAGKFEKKDCGQCHGRRYFDKMQSKMDGK